MNISEEEASLALKQIASSQEAMRRAIRTQCGHYYLWIWGAVWMAMAINRALDLPRYWVMANWLTLAGTVVSVGVGVSQSSRFRAKVDKRFLAVCAAILGFGYILFPLFFKIAQNYDTMFGYQAVLWMQLYIVGGIWFDNSLVWIGLIACAVIVAGFLLVPAYFWVAAFLAGATLFASGFYVGKKWR